MLFDFSTHKIDGVFITHFPNMHFQHLLRFPNRMFKYPRAKFVFDK